MMIFGRNCLLKWLIGCLLTQTVSCRCSILYTSRNRLLSYLISANYLNVVDNANSDALVLVLLQSFSSCSYPPLIVNVTRLF
ncbi:hypothetical protein EDC96DRAFT_492660 [Choanephora cucurbitarum]|nr:hypothetical protein EDC96DRAFT_492660 [Choanephora cucurbitarum]